MKICELTDKEVENIIDQFEDARYLKLKGKKLITDIMKKYDLNRKQLWEIAAKNNKVKLMRRHDANQISQE